jgi:anti-sigma B factor antagonist
MSMEVTERADGISIIGWSDSVALDAADAPELRTEVSGLLIRCSRLVFDMSQVEFVDSSIIGALVGFLRRARAAGGDMKLVGLTPNVETIFEVTRLQRVFSIHPSIPAAIEEFGSAVS